MPLPFLEVRTVLTTLASAWGGLRSLWPYISSSLPISSCRTGVWHASGPQSIMAESVMAKLVKHLLLQRLGILAQPQTSWVALGKGLNLLESEFPCL